MTQAASRCMRIMRPSSKSASTSIKPVRADAWRAPECWRRCGVQSRLQLGRRYVAARMWGLAEGSLPPWSLRSSALFVEFVAGREVQSRIEPEHRDHRAGLNEGWASRATIPARCPSGWRRLTRIETRAHVVLDVE